MNLRYGTAQGIAGVYDQNAFAFEKSPDREWALDTEQL